MYTTQSIQRPAGVNVFGSCLIRTEPDYATLRFTVAALAPEPSAALAEAKRASDEVRGVLVRHGIAVNDVRAAPLTLQLAWEGYGENRRSIGYRVAIPYVVLARELRVVEDLLVAIVAAGAREIDSISYKSSQLKELRAQARRGAVAAARRKAQLYAEAAGARVGKVLHIEDVNPDEMSARSHMPDVDLSEHDESALSGAERPGSIVIAAAVMGCFALID
jgi:uncharacterized protein